MKEPFLFMMYPKKLIALIVFAVIITQSYAQQGISISVFPKNKHFYQRDDDDKVMVSLAGKSTNSLNKSISILVKRGSSPYYYSKTPLVYSNNSSNFQFEVVINAELAEYEFSLYSHGEKDSALVAKAEKVLCGESIIIYGQSNAQAEILNGTYNFNTPFGRTFYMNFNSSEQEWTDLNHPHYFTSIGIIGLELQRFIIEKYKIPVAIINGAVGGIGIDELSHRYLSNFTYYDQLYQRLKNSGLKDKSKIFIWRQGEREGWDKDVSYDYAKYFEKLYNQVFTDFTGVEYFYNFQNNLLPTLNPKAGNIREYQRKTRYLFPKIRTMSSIGTQSYDGLHYEVKGYQESAADVFKVIDNDFFTTIKSNDAISPDIQGAYLNFARDTLTLKFDTLQTIKYPSSVTNIEAGVRKKYRLVDLIFLDETPINADTGFVKGNKIYFPLKSISPAKEITYMPDYWKEIGLQTKIPIITNSIGLKALSFKKIPITIESKRTAKDLILQSNNDELEKYILQPNPVKKGTPLLITTYNNSIIKQLNVYNKYGILVRNSAFNLNEKSIYTDSLIPGLYLVELFVENKRIVKKFVVE